jgi:hypothetical protein
LHAERHVELLLRVNLFDLDSDGSAIAACFVPPRFSRLTEIVIGRRGSTICVNNPESTESAPTSAPGHNESEFAAYATIRSYWRVSVRFSVTH